jgi:hypothetical protein
MFACTFIPSRFRIDPNSVCLGIKFRWRIVAARGRKLETTTPTMTRKEAPSDELPAKRLKTDTFPSMLRLKPTTFMEESSALSRAMSFLPLLKQANEKLTDCNMEDVTSDHYIEMDLDCGLFDVTEKAASQLLGAGLNAGDNSDAPAPLILEVSAEGNGGQGQVEVNYRNLLLAKGRMYR